LAGGKEVWVVGGPEANKYSQHFAQVRGAGMRAIVLAGMRFGTRLLGFLDKAGLFRDHFETFVILNERIRMMTAMTAKDFWH